MFSALFSIAFVAGAYKMFPPSADFPDLSQHNNVMASHLTPQVLKSYVIIIHAYTMYQIYFVCIARMRKLIS